MKQYVGIARDHSVSMQGITRAARDDYNDNIAAIQEAGRENSIDTIVSTVKFGQGVQREVVNSNVNVLQPLFAYEANQGSTSLWDAVGELITLLEAVPDRNDPNVSFLIMVITDGEENSSRKWSGSSLATKIRALQATDRWTFTFRVPSGYGRQIRNIGIPEGNINEWETTTKGMEKSSQATISATRAYYSGRASGLTSTKSFYTADLSGITNSAVKAALVNVSNSVTPLLVAPDGIAIKDFIESRYFTYTKGCTFYQLTKTENQVQDYKKICIRDRMNGNVYYGAAARQLLGLPTHGTIKLVPGHNSGYDIFIQSTSVNRKLVGGTTVLYWPDIDRYYL